MLMGVLRVSDTKQLFKEFQKEYGEKIGGQDYELIDIVRIPTGYFAFDLASGGGFPRGRISIIYGPESSGKTNLVLKLIANHQRLWPDQQCVFFDIENTYDPDWAEKLGVNNKALYLSKPEYAEQCVDMVESLLRATDIGLVAIDSLAAMVTTQEFNSSAEKANVGGSALAVGKLIRKSVLSLTRAEKENRMPSLVLVNQTRWKIGKYGNPETQPGGNAPQFACSMRVRTYGKNITDPKINDHLPIRKKTSIVINKWKVPILYDAAEYEMVCVPHKGLKVGDCDDWGTVSAYLEQYELHGKTEDGKRWHLAGEEYKTLKACKERYYSDPDLADALRSMLVTKIGEENEAVVTGVSQKKDEDVG